MFPANRLTAVARNGEMTDEEFTPRWLYVKKCSHCDLKYFGTTVRANVERYRGSGSRWVAHLQRHKAKAITIAKRFYESHQREECMRRAIEFSKEHDIVASREWANAHVETGALAVNGGWFVGNQHSKKTLKIISQSNKGKVWFHDPHSSFATKLFPGDRTIKKLGLVRGMHPNHLRHLAKTEEHKAKIGNGNRGKAKSAETRAKLSAALKGRPGHTPWNKGMRFTEKRK